jgi:hypothetical protein
MARFVRAAAHGLVSHALGMCSKTDSLANFTVPALYILARSVLAESGMGCKMTVVEFVTNSLGHIC